MIHDSTTIHYTIHYPIANIILNRPEKRNALNGDMITSMHHALGEMEKDENIKVVILKASGPTFCAGIDLAHIQKLQHASYEENLQDAQNLANLFYKIYSYPKIVIAEIAGYALGGGCGLALVADFSFAYTSSKFGFPEVKIGFLPAIVLPFLVHKIGMAQAKELLLTGNMLCAQDAAAQNLINYCVEEDQDLPDTVNKFATQLIQENDFSAMIQTKKMLISYGSSWKADLDNAVIMHTKRRATLNFQKK